MRQCSFASFNIFKQVQKEVDVELYGFVGILSKKGAKKQLLL
jgi:hypothetical protein